MLCQWVSLEKWILTERGRILMVLGGVSQSEVLISWTTADQQRESVLLPTPPSKVVHHRGAHETAVSTESGLCVGQNPGGPGLLRPRPLSGTALPSGACGAGLCLLRNHNVITAGNGHHVPGITLIALAHLTVTTTQVGTVIVSQGGDCSKPHQ